MRWLINYFRSCLCKHEFTKLKEITYYSGHDTSKLPHKAKYVYRCEKCGYIYRVRL